MSSFPAYELDLPFEHTLIGYMDTCGRSFVTVARANPHHPFCTYAVEPKPGKYACYFGHYFDTRSEALRDLADRAGAFLARPLLD